MANQMYGYNPSSYNSSIYPSSTSSYLSDPSLIGAASSRYLTSADHHPLAPSSDSSKYQSYFHTDPYSRYNPTPTEYPPLPPYSSTRPLSHSSWPSLDFQTHPPFDPNLPAAAAAKRPNEALYHQTALGTQNTIGQSEAFLSTNTLAKRPRVEPATSLHVYPQRPGEKDCAHYMLTRTCKFGENCKFDHPVWVPEGGIPDWKEVPLVPVTEALPERPGEPDCPYFLKTQKCKFGFRCKFNHPKEKIDSLSLNAVEAVDVSVLPERPSEPTCTFYMKTGKCKYGAACKFHHPKDIQIPAVVEENGNEGQTGTAVNDIGTTTTDVIPVKPFVPFAPALMHNSKGLPVRPGEVDCPFYLKTGSCKYGATCRYNHPDRFAMNPPVAAGLGPAIVPSPATTMNMGIVNPAASILPSIDPRLAPHTTLGLNPSVYPQRPGQIECDFYMKTGICKFGERCKFHHPVDRSAPTPSIAKQAPQQNVKLTLAGLPRREGMIICPFYLKTGTCKYGVTCRFDHPPPGEAIKMATVQGTSASVGQEEQGKETDTNQEQH